MSKAEQLITRAFDENNEWLSVVPDDYRRFSSVPIKIPLFGILIMIFGFLVAWNDGDASITKPLPQQLYIILAGLGLFLFSLLLIKLQYKEIRWIQNERTFIVFNKGIIGSIFLEMVYHVEDGDKLSLDQETLGHWEDSPSGESSEYKTETTYWLTIERSNGNLVKTVLGDDVLLGSKNQVSDIKKFILSHS
jgi:hypothetical protein